MVTKIWWRQRRKVLNVFFFLLLLIHTTGIKYEDIRIGKNNCVIQDKVEIRSMVDRTKLRMICCSRTDTSWLSTVFVFFQLFFRNFETLNF